VREHDVLGVITDPLGHNSQFVRATSNGIVVGQNNLPLVNEGDALFHIARFESTAESQENEGPFHEAVHNVRTFASSIDPPSY
jgi:hypothetical protein